MKNKLQLNIRNGAIEKRNLTQKLNHNKGSTRDIDLLIINYRVIDVMQDHNFLSNFELNDNYKIEDNILSII